MEVILNTEHSLIFLAFNKDPKLFIKERVQLMEAFVA